VDCFLRHHISILFLSWWFHQNMLNAFSFYY
jgi:hypothetical protein